MTAPLDPLQPFSVDGPFSLAGGPVGTAMVQEPAPLPAAPPGTGDAADGPPAGGGGGFGGFLPFLLIGVVFWFLIIGPERKNRKKREVMLGALKKGDKVMTTGGLYGRVSELRDDVVILDTGDVRLKFSRAAIQGIVDGDEAKDLKETKT
jgi:preprotein translocase subunit YajC